MAIGMIPSLALSNVPELMLVAFRFVRFAPLALSVPGTCTVTEFVPSTIVLLAVTCAPAPTAVAFVMPAAPFEFAPMKVLLFSAVFD